jgi:transposase
MEGVRFTTLPLPFPLPRYGLMAKNPSASEANRGESVPRFDDKMAHFLHGRGRVTHKGETMQAYSQDLRERVLRAVDQGMSHQEVVQVLGVSLATIGRYLKQRREMGHVRPKAIPGHPRIKGAALQADLSDQLRANPDATREQHCQMWEERTGIRVSPASISRARMTLGWTRKKRF